MNTTIKVIIRLIATPIFAAFALIGLAVQWVLLTVNFIRYGGEAVVYTKKMNGKSVVELIDKVDDLVKKEA